MSTETLIKNNKDIRKFRFSDKKRSVLLELPIYHEDIHNAFNDSLENKKAKVVLGEIANSIIENLKEDSTLFVYGSPIQLMKFSEIVSNKLSFHYWVALDTAVVSKKNENSLRHNHLGILIYSKNGSLSFLDLKNTKFPHVLCEACKNNVKDWGGKKHLMNLNGTGLSDVWKDLYKIKGKQNDKIIPQISLNKLDTKNSVFDKNFTCPKEVKARIKQLTHKTGLSELKIDRSYLKKINSGSSDSKKVYVPVLSYKNSNLSNKIILGDCIREMEKLSKAHPNGLFDLVFADPPYNLSKNYKEYDDERSSLEYEKWCNRWIELCVKLTKPGGSIFILNIPKWGLSHAQTLNKIAYFRNWIVWDALSTPKGKIMPAHYSLLYYTKDSSTPKFNMLGKVDPISYCVRQNCVKARNNSNEYVANKNDISEIWFDIHRIKHKKDRDDHPCQLPHKLMDRIIQMYSNENDLVFDPFGGAGTTGICAIKNNRRFTLMELDPYYKAIAEKRISETFKTGDVIRTSIKKSRSKYTKKLLETKVQELSSTLNRKPTLMEFTQWFNITLEELKKIYLNPSNVLKAGRIGLLNQQT